MLRALLARRRNAVILLLICSAFFFRGLFYCIEQPLWEGYDEWAHFAYVHDFAQFGRSPSRRDALPGYVQQSLHLLPLSQSAAQLVPGADTYETFWNLSEEKRRAREHAIQQLTSGYPPGTITSPLKQYEAQQPPLYYALVAPLYWLVRTCSLPSQVLALRIVTLALAVPTIMLAFGIATCIAATRRAGVIAAILASSPAFLIDVCRVGNDSLAITFSSAVIFCAVLSVTRRTPSLKLWAVLGAFLGAALLTKTYALALVPLLFIVFVLDTLMRKRFVISTALGALLALGIAFAESGWWYLESWRQTRTVSGEQLDVLAGRLGIGGKLSSIPRVDWQKVADSVAITHIWVGGWSFLVARSWMYRVFELIAVVAIAGLLMLVALRLYKAVRRKSLGESTARLILIASSFLLVCFGVWYYALVVFIVKGASVSLGWYLYPAISVEFVLLACGFSGIVGLRRGVILSAGTAMLALAMGVYTMHFILIPHYIGLMFRKPSGTFAAVGISDLIRLGAHEILVRIGVNKPPLLTPAVVAVTWVLYILATIALGSFCAIQIARSLQTHHATPPLRRNATV